MNKCPRCGIGYDTNGDGNCGICAKWSEIELLALKFYGDKMSNPEKNFNVLLNEQSEIVAKVWNKNVLIDPKAIEQIKQTASMPFVKPYVAVMPDAHFGMGATVGSVVPTKGAIIPAAVGVDIGCGMMAVRTDLKFNSFDRSDFDVVEMGYRSWNAWAFAMISASVPHGRTNDGGPGDRGAWHNVPEDIAGIWEKEFAASFDELGKKHPGAISKNAERQLGTLGTGNHFIEVCVETDNPDSNLWIVIHSGSRGFGNRIGSYFTKLAGQLCADWHIKLPNRDLGYLPESTQEYEDYLSALTLAQRFAWVNREIMMSRVLKALGAEEDINQEGVETTVNGPGWVEKGFPSTIHMHHNYMERFKTSAGTVNLTRKGAVDASFGKFVIIPGSMGTKTYIARGYGNADSFSSCSHGAGRSMSRTEAKRRFTVEDHVKATEGVTCHKGIEVIDETPASYKNIDDVMSSQSDLVEPIFTLKQLVCVKGLGE